MSDTTTPNSKSTVQTTVLPIRYFDTAVSTTDSLRIQITEPRLKADNLVLETWASSSILAAQLHLIPLAFHPTSTDARPVTVPILELGAGTGLVGITASIVYGQAAVLTDLPPIVPGLEANIDLNAALLPEDFTGGDRTGTTTTGEVPHGLSAGVLDWTSPQLLSVRGASFDVATTKAHLILAADTVYSEEHPDLLSGTVAAWLSRDPDARFVMGTALRVAYLDEIRAVWSRLEEVGLVCDAEGRGMASEEDFDDERLVEWSSWRWADLVPSKRLGSGDD